MEEIFQKSWNQCPKISGPLKPMYLEWLVLSQGITFARRAYDAMCELPTPCLEMHKKMIYLESIQPTMNMKRIRQSYRAACDQFGSRDVGKSLTLMVVQGGWHLGVTLAVKNHRLST